MFLTPMARGTSLAQTDADVSGENSGGALFDSSGRMIGMTLIPLGRNIVRRDERLRTPSSAAPHACLCATVAESSGRVLPPPLRHPQARAPGVNFAMPIDTLMQARTASLRSPLGCRRNVGL